MEPDQTTNLQQWLDHFGNFETYVEFFCFEDFCPEIKNKYAPLDMTQPKSNSNKAEIINESKIENLRKSKFSIYKDLKLEEIETMLDTLSNNVLKRSERMLNVLIDASSPSEPHTDDTDGTPEP
jgi:hypothetical protein